MDSIKSNIYRAANRCIYVVPWKNPTRWGQITHLNLTIKPAKDHAKSSLTSKQSRSLLESWGYKTKALPSYPAKHYPYNLLVFHGLVLPDFDCAVILQRTRSKNPFLRMAADSTDHAGMPMRCLRRSRRYMLHDLQIRTAKQKSKSRVLHYAKQPHELSNHHRVPVSSKSQQMN